MPDAAPVTIATLPFRLFMKPSNTHPPSTAARGLPLLRPPRLPIVRGIARDEAFNSLAFVNPKLNTHDDARQLYFDARPS